MCVCVCKCTLVQTKCRKSEGHFVIYDQILDQNIDSNNDYSGNYIKEEEKEAIKMVNNDYWLYIYLSRSFPFFLLVVTIIYRHSIFIKYI